MTMTKQKYLTVKEIQEELGYLRPDAIYKWIRKGLLPARKPGNGKYRTPWLILREDFENFMQAGR